ncbi:MAG: hypothetical protein KC656_02130 [Myxococcales bacterium]|nr:hypothetical protein [Myxococcales bacterium]
MVPAAALIGVALAGQPQLVAGHLPGAAAVAPRGLAPFYAVHVDADAPGVQRLRRGGEEYVVLALEVVVPRPTDPGDVRREPVRSPARRPRSLLQQALSSGDLEPLGGAWDVRITSPAWGRLLVGPHPGALEPIAPGGAVLVRSALPGDRVAHCVAVPVRGGRSHFGLDYSFSVAPAAVHRREKR